MPTLQSHIVSIFSTIKEDGDYKIITSKTILGGVINISIRNNMNKPITHFFSQGDFQSYFEKGDVLDITGSVVSHHASCSIYIQKINTTTSTTQINGTWNSPEKSCVHEWKEYIGFTERYNYCTKCDSKENQ